MLVPGGRRYTISASSTSANTQKGGPMYHECRHILPNGKRCQSPALRNHDFCYFHSVHRVRPDAEVTSDLQLPPLEDPDAIQLALSQLAQAIASGRMEVRRARTLAMVLRIASQNFRHTLAARQQLENKPQEEEPKIYQPETVRETCPHADGTLIAPPKECPDPEEIPVPESKWSLGRLLLKEAELFRERRRREKAELEEKIRNSERGARFFGFEPDPPQPGTLPTVKAESFCKPRPCK
ncbi:MAG: hypothetical protein IRZ03_10150, partial [Acidobacterium ailaaui]|nr:hypothetical protein [Pseudacidobacterium ailaaui]